MLKDDNEKNTPLGNVVGFFATWGVFAIFGVPFIPIVIAYLVIMTVCEYLEGPNGKIGGALVKKRADLLALKNDESQSDSVRYSAGIWLELSDKMSSESNLVWEKSRSIALAKIAAYRPADKSDSNTSS